MKKTKLKERLDKALAAFWDDAETTENELEIMPYGETVLLKEKGVSGEKIRNIFGLLKQVLLFLPGTFFTFYLWMGLTIFGLPSGRKPLLFFLILILSPLSIVIGLGDIKKLKHWIMPLSVMVMGVLIGIIMNSSAGLSQFIKNFENAVLFFPLALIVAVLSKNWVDSFDQEPSN